MSFVTFETFSTTNIYLKLLQNKKCKRSELYYYCQRERNVMKNGMPAACRFIIAKYTNAVEYAESRKEIIRQCSSFVFFRRLNRDLRKFKTNIGIFVYICEQ